MALPVKQTLITLSPLIELILGAVLGGLLTLVFATIFPGTSPQARWAFFGATALLAFLGLNWVARRR